MKYSYPFFHWVTTLVLGPIVYMIYDLLSPADLMPHGDLVGFFVLASFVLSLPTFLIYLLIYAVMIKRRISAVTIKFALDTGVVILIALMFTLLLGGPSATALIVSYSTAVVICSLPFRIYKRAKLLNHTTD